MTWISGAGGTSPITLTGIVLNSGDTLVADRGGTAIDTTVNSGGLVFVDDTASGDGTVRAPARQ
jgi:autotransporter passenger strand-loop-strand repeat protein